MARRKKKPKSYTGMLKTAARLGKPKRKKPVKNKFSVKVGKPTGTYGSVGKAAAAPTKVAARRKSKKRT